MLLEDFNQEIAEEKSPEKFECQILGSPSEKKTEPQLKREGAEILVEEARQSDRSIGEISS